MRTCVSTNPTRPANFMVICQERLNLSFGLSNDKMSILMGKEGRLVLPKKLREKLKVKEGDRFILRECGDQIILIPVTRYAHPTQELHGSVEPEMPIDEPKVLARSFLRKKVRKEFV